jgi:DNA-binding NarL/FixJ family response regulator
MKTAEKESARASVGIVAADPLRSLGLVTILETVANLHAVPLELELMFGDNGLAAVLLDARSTGDKLTETIGKLRREQPALKIVAMGVALEPDRVQAVIAAGAKGYLAETAGESEIRMAMEVVLDGSVWRRARCWQS